MVLFIVILRYFSFISMLKKKCIDFLFFIAETVLLFFPLYILNLIKLNYIWGSFGSALTFFQGTIPALFYTNFFGTLTGFYYLFCGLITSKLFSVLCYKLPSIFSIFIFNVLQKYTNKKIKILLISLFIIASLFFIFYCKHTFIMTIPWFLLSVYMIIFINRSYSIFEICFLSSWAAQILGTIVYGLKNGFLSDNQYILLLPVAIGERFLLSFTLFFYFKYLLLVKFFLKKYKVYCIEVLYCKN